MSALTSRDFDALEDAINRERKIIEKQNVVLRKQGIKATSRPK
jgi:hypothetical protein